jgi:hypothetical protein
MIDSAITAETSINVCQTKGLNNQKRGIFYHIFALKKATEAKQERHIHR